MQPEVRLVSGLELRAGDDGRKKFRGYAAVFDAEAEIAGVFRESIAPGAFRSAIEAEADVRALWNHNPDHVLGRTTAGTLRMAEDDHGLAVEIDPPDTQLARDLAVLVERGDVSQMSFGFIVRKQEWSEDRTKRRLIEVEPFDVSLVTYPAYEQTEIALRSGTQSVIDKIARERREREEAAARAQSEYLRLAVRIRELE